MDEILELQNYCSQLEKLVLNLAEENLSYRKLVKRRLKKYKRLTIEFV
jgi:hypothetical protein